MDPQATLDMLLEALEAKDWELAAELSEALQTWLARGGFPPDTIGPTSLGTDWHRAIARAICETAMARTERLASPVG